MINVARFINLFSQMSLSRALLVLVTLCFGPTRHAQSQTFTGEIIGQPNITERLPSMLSFIDGRADYFYRKADQTLGHRWTLANGLFSAEENLGGDFSSGPQAVSWGPGHMAVFVKANDSTVKYRQWDGTSWGPWINLGGSWHWEPAVVSMYPGHMAVFEKGTNSVHWRNFDSGLWSPSWVNLSGTAYAKPAAIALGANNMWVFERASGSNYEYKRWDGNSWSSNWTSLGGNFAHYPAPVSRGPGLIDLFGIGNDGKIYLKRFNGSTWEASWVNIGQSQPSWTFSSNPAVVARPTGGLEVYVRGNSTTIPGTPFPGFYIYYTISGDGGNTWTPYTSITSFYGDDTEPDPVAGYAGGTVHAALLFRQTSNNTQNLVHVFGY